MDAIRKVRIGDEELRIFRDEYWDDSPRNWDNLGTMVCFHRRYELGDKHDMDKNDFTSWSDMENHLRKKAVIVIPLFILDHSGVTMQTYPFGGTYGRWDSMQVGFIYVTGEKLRYEYDMFRLSKKALMKAKATLITEVKMFDQYLRGDVYSFSVVRLETCPNCGIVGEETIDSCGGFFGDSYTENGMLDYLGKKWKDALREDANE